MFCKFHHLPSKISGTCYQPSRTLSKHVLYVTSTIYIQVEDIEFDGVPVRVYIPEEQKKPTSPAILYLHGGGWMFMSLGESINALLKLMKLSIKLEEQIFKLFTLSVRVFCFTVCSQENVFV